MEYIDNIRRVEVHVMTEVSHFVIGYQHQLASAHFNEGFFHDILVVVNCLRVSKLAKSLIICLCVLDVCFGRCTTGEESVGIIPSFFFEDRFQPRKDCWDIDVFVSVGSTHKIGH